MMFIDEILFVVFGSLVGTFLWGIWVDFESICKVRLETQVIVEFMNCFSFKVVTKVAFFFNFGSFCYGNILKLKAHQKKNTMNDWFKQNIVTFLRDSKRNFNCDLKLKIQLQHK